MSETVTNGSTWDEQMKLLMRAENAEKSEKATFEIAARLLRERDEMRAALEWYANPEIYKPHPHGPAFDGRDLSFHALAALSKLTHYDPTTQPFDEPHRHVED